MAVPAPATIGPSRRPAAGRGRRGGSSGRAAPSPTRWRRRPGRSTRPGRTVTSSPPPQDHRHRRSGEGQRGPVGGERPGDPERGRVTLTEPGGEEGAASIGDRPAGEVGGSRRGRARPASDSSRGAFAVRRPTRSETHTSGRKRGPWLEKTSRIGLAARSHGHRRGPEHPVVEGQVRRRPGTPGGARPPWRRPARAGRPRRAPGGRARGAAAGRGGRGAPGRGGGGRGGGGGGLGGPRWVGR